MRAARGAGRIALLTAATLAGSCGGGGGSTATAPPQPPPFTSVAQVRVSQASTYAAGCDRVTPTGTLYTDTVAEPFLAVNPTSPANLIGAWQQNRWSDGGAQGINLAASFDGGMTWTLTNAAFSRCTGGNSGNNGDYARATDVWIAITPQGVAFTLALSITGTLLASGSSSAMLVSRSADGGLTWGTPTPLIVDAATAANDKGSITADPTDAHFVYATWDRLTGQSAADSYFAATADGGSTWQAAKSIYHPGATSQTIGNQIAVLPDGTLLDVFTELDTAANNTVTAQLRVIRSGDHGASWSSTPVTVSDLTARGTSDPQTGAAIRDGSELASVSVAPGGVVYVAWQDARFSGGARDGIALTHSSDGGLTWSAPVQVNHDTSVQAFTPTVHVRGDGAIAVTYYDLRNDTTAAGSLYADCWMVTSRDGVTFTESHLSGPFDLDLAPNSEGLFLGDYQGLASTPSAFLPFYVQTDAGNQVRSDAFIDFPPAGATAATVAFTARPSAPGVVLGSEARQRVMERIRLTQAQRRRQPG
jgi:hypothetical protein